MERENEREVTRRRLRELLFRYPRGKERAAVRLKIAEACHVRISTINNWMSGVCAIPPLAQEKINEVVGEKIFFTNCEL